MTLRAFELWLFSARPEHLRAAAGLVDGVIVDLEQPLGKRLRQRQYDTEVNQLDPHALEQAAHLLRGTDCRLSCRVDVASLDEDTLTRLLATGTSELILPMVTSPAEVELALRRVNARAHVSIMVETVQAVACLADLAKLPIARAYVGLHDLSIARQTELFAPFVDGTLRQVSDVLNARHIPWSAAGLTIPGGGSPIANGQLLAALLSWGARFGILRRTFFREVEVAQWPAGLRAIRADIAKRLEEQHDSHRHS